MNIKTHQPIRPKFKAISGFTLMELLAGILVSSLILIVAGAGLGAILSVNHQSDIKNTRRVELSRALGYINGEIKEGKAVEKVNLTEDANCSTNVTDSGNYCLTITKPNGDKIYYGFKDISGVSSSNSDYIWFKPGILHRRLNNGNTYVLVDGLINSNPTSLPTCSTTLTGSGGFRFCLGSTASDNRTVKIYLYGYTGSGTGDTPITMETENFARSNNSN
jgi:type II secretory pathway pseudopilin PulG